MIGKSLSLVAAVCLFGYSAFAVADVSGYEGSATVTVAGIGGGETLTNFPVLVRLSETIEGFSYSYFRSADGGDLLFTDADGNELASEVDTWNPSGESLVWVRLPELGASGATLKMYFSSVASAKTLASSDVWCDYAAVWHMNVGDGGVVANSAAAELPLSVKGEAGTNSWEKLGATRTLKRASKTNGLKSPTIKGAINIGRFSVSGWFKPSEYVVDQNARLLSWKNGSGDKTGFEFIAVGGTKLLFVRGSGDASSNTGRYGFAGAWTAGTWTHLIGVYDGTTPGAYTNGVVATPGDGHATPLPTTVSAGDLKLGVGNMGGDNIDEDGNGLDGQLDEIRIYNGVVTAARAKAEYDTVMSEGFATVSDVSVSAEFVGFDGEPVVTRTDDATPTLSVRLAEVSASAADVYAIAIDCESGVAVTNLLAASASPGETVGGALAGLPPNRTYAFSVFAVCGSAAPVVSECVPRFYIGTPTSDRYVSVDGNDLNDGYSAFSPKATISAALVTLSADGGTVYLADGTYYEETVGSAIQLSTPVMLVGASGDPSRVVITRKVVDGRILRLDNARAGAKSVTLSGGGWLDQHAYLGGCVYMTEKGGILEDCIVENGTCGRKYETGVWGGNVAMLAGRMSRCVIRGGKLAHGAHYGSGVAALGSALVEDCLIAGNSGPAYKDTYVNGGAVYLAGNAKLVNCTVVDNYDSIHAGVYLAGDTAQVINCAIFGNRIGANGERDLAGGVYNAGADLSRFSNCAAAVELNDSCVCTGFTGFMDAAAGDYTLDAPSPLVDAGAAVTSVKDLVGNARQSGAAVDIGCYERQHPEFEVGYVASRSLAFFPDAAKVVFRASAAPSDGVTYTWDFGDGSAPLVTTETTVEHEFAGTGAEADKGYVTVRLTGEREGKTSETYSSPLTLRVVPRTVYVNAAAASGTFPYDTPAKASKSILKAMEMIEDGMTFVLAKSGKYNESIVITNAVTLKGATGDPADVIVDVSSKGRNLRVGNAGALVSGITFKNGKIDYSGSNAAIAKGGNLWLEDGVVSNCVLEAGFVNSSGGDGGGAYVSGGRLTRCVIRDSKGGNRTTGAIVSQYGGLVDNCLMRDSRDDFVKTKNAMRLVSVKGGRMVNCTIVGGVCVAGGKDATANGFTQQGSGDDRGLVVDGDGEAVNCVVADLRFTNTTAKKPIAISGDAAKIVNCVCDDPQSSAVATVGTLDELFVDYAGRDLAPAKGGLLFNRGSDSCAALIGGIDLAGKPRVMGSAVDIGCYEGQRGLGMVFTVR